MNGPWVSYHAYFNGEPLTEENAVVGGTEKSSDALNKMRIAVEAGVVGVDETGKPVVWFRLRCVRESDAHETVVHRRFRDFYAINEALRSSYKGSHLLTSFPDLPSRSFKLWDDHMSEAFIEKRRGQLHDWVTKIACIPRMRSNPDFLTFLGLIDSLREVSVLFPKDVPLGISVAKKGDFVEVVALKPLADGSPSPAQMSGLIQVGDKVSKINGADSLSDTHDVIVAKLRTAPRPLMIHFLGIIATPPGGGASTPTAAAGAASAAAGTAAVATAAAEPAPPAADVVTGLIGDGVSYVGTGATPRPGMAARTGLDHHASAAAAAAEEEARAAETAAVGGSAATATDNPFGGLL